MGPGDRDTVLSISAEAGFFGQPVESILDDRSIFCDLQYRYYVDLEPGHAWVAEVQGRVVGAIVGTADTRAMRGQWLRRVLPGFVWRAITCRYRLGRRSVRRLVPHVLSALRSEAPRVDLTAYPAQLHINVSAEERGRGLGRGLMEAFLAQLRQEGSPGVHLRTTNLNVAACGLYSSMGFVLMAERRTREWEDVIPGPAFNRVYGLRL